jgi:hypothetical protein
VYPLITAVECPQAHTHSQEVPAVAGLTKHCTWRHGEIHEPEHPHFSPDAPNCPLQQPLLLLLGRRSGGADRGERSRLKEWEELDALSGYRLCVYILQE